MLRYLFGLLCCSGATLSQETRSASVRGASRPRGLISTAHSDECDVLLCGMSGVGKSTLLHNIKVGTVEHSCYPVPREWDAFAEDLRLHGPFGDNSFKVRHVDTCRLPCAGCGSKRIKMTADLAVLRRHWMKRITARYKGGVLYAMRKNMWNCLGQWARSQDAEDYDLTVNVGLDGRYCVRAGGRANATYA